MSKKLIICGRARSIPQNGYAESLDLYDAEEITQEYKEFWAEISTVPTRFIRLSMPVC